MDLILTKGTMQDAGSAVTYARRYSLQSLLSMRAEDDDGEVSMGRGKKSSTKPSTKATTKAETKASPAAKKKASFKPDIKKETKTTGATGAWS